jgi:L-ribulokinase
MAVDPVADCDELFAEYRRLHDYFGRGENKVMHHLGDLRRHAHGRG